MGGCSALAPGQSTARQAAWWQTSAGGYETNIKQIYSGKIVILKIPEGDGIDIENYEKYSTAMYCSSLVENIRSEGDEKNI